MSAVQFSRRHPLALSGSLGALAIGGTLTGCGPGGSQDGGAAKSATLKLPTYKEFTGIRPDLPGDTSGLQPGFLATPTDAVASTKRAPLTSDVTVLSETFTTPPPGMGSNPFWQRLNAELGGKLQVTIGTDPGYPEKFATILARDDLPDMMWLPPNQGIPNVGPMLEAKFADLTAHLSGDAVLDYPNLAALKPDSWRTAVVNGKIWGAPIPSTPFGQVMIGHPDLWGKVGGFSFDSADDFLAKAKEMTNPKSKVYALEPAYINMMHMFGEWFGAPTGWRVNQDRTLTNIYEADEYFVALEFGAKVFAAGCFYPDANLPDARPKVAQGSIAAYVSVGPTGVNELRQFDKSLQGVGLVPFGWDGTSEPNYDTGYGTVGFTPFKKADESRIKELLSLINWRSAPFGTKEYLQKNYGTEGKDFTFDSQGNANLTKSGTTDAPGRVSALQIMSSSESVIYSTQYSDDTKRIYALEKELLKHAHRNPTAGTYSDTNSKKGAKLSQQITDAVTEVVTGRRKPDTFKDAVKRWRDGGGDKIREQYQKVLPKDVSADDS